MGVSMLALTAAVLPTALNVALNPTRTRSEAALLPQTQPISTEFEVPTGPPAIYLVDHFFGKPGDAVLVHGENLGGLHENSWVSLAGEKIAIDNLVSWTGSYIEFKVPDTAKSGRVEVSILGKQANWSGMFFVTDVKTKAELRLADGYLKASEIQGGKNLLVWFLIIRGEGEVTITPVNKVKATTKEIDLPIGKVYQVNIDLNSELTNASKDSLVNLVKVDKSEDVLVGIARGELENGKGELVPLQAHPLYVSF